MDFNLISLWDNTIAFLEPWIAKIAIAAIIIFVGLISGKLLYKFLFKLLKEIGINKIFKKTTGMGVNLQKYLAGFAKYFVIFFSIIFALESLGWDSVVLYILVSGIIIIFGISLLLGIKDFFPNIISGFLLNKRDFLKIGDKIKVKNVEGEIVHIGLIEIKVMTALGDEIIMPNSMLFKSKIIKLRNKAKK